MSRLIRDPETGLIKKLRVTEAVASYAYLVSPRPEGMLQEGTYGSELIIRDEETIKLIKEYVKEVASNAIKGAWKLVPSAINRPYRDGNEDNEREAGAFVLKTSSPKFQPKLLIRNPRTGRATELTEEEKEEFYSGMIVDVDVTFRDWSVGGKYGVTAYLNAVCKVGDGEPFATGGNIEDSFSIDLGFDDEDSFDVEEPKAKPAVKPKKKTAKEVDEEEVDALLEGLIDDEPAAKPAKPATTKKAAPKKELTIDDLLD